MFLNFSTYVQKESSANRHNLNKNLETLDLTPLQFYHLPGFYPKAGFLRNYTLSLTYV